MCAKPRGLGLGLELMKEEGSLFPSGDDPREVPAEVWSGQGGREARSTPSSRLLPYPREGLGLWLSSPPPPTCNLRQLPGWSLTLASLGKE